MQRHGDKVAVGGSDRGECWGDWERVVRYARMIGEEVGDVVLCLSFVGVRGG